MSGPARRLRPALLLMAGAAARGGCLGRDSVYVGGDAGAHEPGR
jgi:hypothetical protein